jgi:DNA-binding winged helix-turn-helix (wHTH) protein
MPPELTLSFGPYRLAGPHGPLWREAQVVPLPPKALAVLWQLARQAGQVVTKDALLEAGWAGTVVSDW